MGVVTGTKKEKEALREQVAAIVAGYNVTAPNENDQFDIKKAVLRILNLHFNFDPLRNAVWRATFHQKDSQSAASLRTDPSRLEEDDPMTILDGLLTNETFNSWTWADDKSHMISAEILVDLFTFLYLPSYTIGSYQNVRWTTWKDTENVNTKEFVNFYRLAQAATGKQISNHHILLLFFAQTCLMDKNAKEIVQYPALGLSTAEQESMWMEMENNRYNFAEGSHSDEMYQRRADLISSWSNLMRRLLVVTSDRKANRTLGAIDLLPVYHSIDPDKFEDQEEITPPPRSPPPETPGEEEVEEQ